ncbi:hypothetical protein GQ44DRAFT_729430 [Phaeosphaeriaceae sp. PMI808]|nr:hypothetical protein GQ44DRAFT_729430 [Phaeosphaeriaceae sp. PMI808]
MTRKAVDATTGNDLERASLLGNLGVWLGDRYERTGTTSDLEETIRVTREAIAATPDHNADRAVLLGDLGIWLRDRCVLKGKNETTEAIVDLEKRFRSHEKLSCLIQMIQAEQNGWIVSESDLAIVIYTKSHG